VVGDWGYVVAGYGLTATALVAYIVSLRRRADALGRSRGRPDEEEAR
jgi:hypothetical protein